MIALLILAVLAAAVLVATFADVAHDGYRAVRTDHRRLPDRWA